MSTVYSGYSAGWKPSGSDIYKKYRARLDYSLVSETATTITYKAVLYVNINSSVNASYSGTLNISGTTYTGSCKTVFGKTNTVTCVSAKTKTFAKGATATTATIKGSVKSSSGSWTGASVVASATVTIPALAPATITFNANSGSGTVPSAISTYVGVANTIPSNSLTRTGYTFNGWNTASDGSGTAYATGSTITPSGNVTLYAQWKTTYVKPEIQNLLAFRTANASGGASPTVTSTGTTGFCKFQLVGGANYTFTSATVQFGTAAAKSMTKSGSTLYGYSTVGSIAQASAYTVKVTVVVKGTDGISRTYTDSTYISKSVPVFDASNDGNCFAFFGTATDGLPNKKLLVNGELAFDTAATAAAAVNNLMAFGLAGGTSIPSNADLNDYKTVGNYFSAGSTISSTLLNTPVTEAGFMLKVLYGYGKASTGAILIQKVIHSVTGTEYTRYFYQDNWSPWVKTLTSGLGIEAKKLLWTNASPTSAFAAQTVLNNPPGQLSDYDFVWIEYCFSSSYTSGSGTERVRVGASGTTVLRPTSTSNVTGARYASVSTSGVLFSDAYYNTEKANAYAIPLRIYGIKEV